MIPKGDLIKLDPETVAKLPEKKVQEMQFINDYMVRLTQYAENQRQDRISTGVEDKPTVPVPSPTLSKFGELEFKFPGNVQKAGETTMDSEEASKSLFSGRVLQTVTNNKIDFNINDFMKFTLVPGEGSAEPSMLRFTPVLTDFTSDTFSVRFDWDYPLQVSTGTTKDKVKSEFTDPRLFLDP